MAPILRPVILCGGSGTRLWPLSRAEYPKQFMDLAGDTLFAGTVRRGMALPHAADPLVVCNESHRFFAAGILQQLGIQADILLEPEGRNTAPAIALAALFALSSGQDPVLMVLPSDHNMQPVENLYKAVEQALPAALAGKLVTFGIRPDQPETGFGYICQGKALPGMDNVFAINKFVEKPQKDVAQQLLETGNAFWNSGMFLLKASVYLEELRRHTPSMMEAINTMWASRRKDFDFWAFDKTLCKAVPADSIDYAVMEHTQNAAVVPFEIAWNELGSWLAFYEMAPKDKANNACLGDTLLEDVQGSYIHATSRLVAALGLKDTVIVETADAVLVADKNRTQEVKNILARMKAEGRKEIQNHLKVLRPWGSYQVLALGDRFQVKRIELNPGAQISLQLHHHRAEHWVVVHGTARVTTQSAGGEIKASLYSEDESAYIPLGSVHRLENPGVIPLVLVEIQTGSYLGEDDIVRLEDNYGRVQG